MSRRLTNIELDQIDEIVERYQQMVKDKVTGALKDCRIQFTHMAAGGSGGPTGHDDGSTIRGYYYRGQRDVFFQRVCERMRWEW